MTRNTLVPTLFAVGGSMAAGSAGAIELGDIDVESSLGEPLRASIAFALGPNEELQKYCVSASGAASSSGVPTVPNPQIEIGDGRITVTSRRAIREPIVSTRLTVNCPYTPHIIREYTMFLSPAGLETRSPAPVAERPQQSAAATLQTNSSARAATRSTPAATPGPGTVPIQQGSEYRVQPGDSLSAIAQRIENRQIRLWPAVNALFEANPDAFIGSDPNRLKAGSLLTIPSFVGDEVATFATTGTDAPQRTATAGRSTATVVDAASSAADAAKRGTTMVPAAGPAERETSVTPAQVADETASTPDAAKAPVEARPASDADPINDATAAASAETRVVIPDTEIADAIPAADSPNRSVARIQPAAVPASQTTSNSLLWVAGGGALLIAALLLFGRRLRDRFGSTPIGAAESVPQRRATDLTDATTAAELPVVNAIDDDSPTDQNLALDASLGLGHDFDGHVDVDFSDEGGLDGTTRLDIELPVADENGTDVISAPHIDTSSILESEVLPDDDDYDMSVIMDMTKMPRPEDVTEKDLRAVEVSDVADGAEDGSYTMNDEADYDILEQDYQDELSATQALNLEIEKAAQELSARLEQDDTASTTGIQIADVEEMDITATVQAQNDEELSDLDDTNVNEALQLPEEDTVKLSDADKTAEMPRPGDSVTVEMPRRVAQADDTDAITSDGDHTVEIITRDDDTVEMEVEGGRVNTKNS